MDKLLSIKSARLILNTVLAMAIASTISPIYATSLKAGCATIEYDPLAFKAYTFKEIVVIGKASALESVNVLCDGVNYYPVNVTNYANMKRYTFNLLVDANSRCLVNVVCANGAVTNQKIAFTPASPSLLIHNIRVLPRTAHLYATFCSAPSSMYDVEVSVPSLGVTKKVTLRLGGQACKKLDLIFENISGTLYCNSTLNAVQVIYRVYKDGVLVGQGKTNIRAEAVCPSLVVNTDQVTDGLNKICLTLYNPSDTPIHNISMTLSLAYSNITNERLNVDTLLPNEIRELCIKGLVTLPSDFALMSLGLAQQYPNSTSRAAASKTGVPLVILLKYSVNGNIGMSKYVKLLSPVSFSWPSVSLIASDPAVPQEGAIFKLLVYVSNPSTLKYYFVTVSVLPRDGTVIVPLNNPIFAIPVLQPMASVPATFYFNLARCSREGTISGYVVLEVHLYSSTKVLKVPFELPASCKSDNYLNYGNYLSNTTYAIEKKSVSRALEGDLGVALVALSSLIAATAASLITYLLFAKKLRGGS